MKVKNKGKGRDKMTQRVWDKNKVTRRNKDMHIKKKGGGKN
jgi:hypothetical protein